MGMMEAIILGVFSLTALMLALICLTDKKYVAAVILSFIALIMTVLSAYNWRLALIDSGKNPALLGFARYPFVPILLMLLLIGSLVAFVLGLWFRKKRKTK